MKIFSLLFFLGLAGAVHAATSAETKKSPAVAPAAKEASTPGKPVVHLGMTPDAVAKIIGKPAKIESVKTPAGEGQRWVYRRLAREWSEQTAATVNMVPSFVGLAMPNAGLGEAAMPANNREHVRVYQVSSLLFVGGTLVAATQKSETEKNFEN